MDDVVIAYDGAEPAGCAAIKRFEAACAEVKRVFVRDSHRGRGISKLLMAALEQKAREKGCNTLILETGEPLRAAMGLYRSIGFRVIPNFGPYKDMPESVCMQKRI